jgi:hypothetical protein
MAENNFSETNFREAVCIDAGRVYDSCCDRDCLEDLRCYFTSENQGIIDDAINVRLRKAEVLNVYIDVEQVNFNKGFYSCDLTFFLLVNLDVFTSPQTLPENINGVAVFNKKVILFGSEGNAKIFSSEVILKDSDQQLDSTSNMPKCVVQTVDPIPLSAKIKEVETSCDNICCIPECICKKIGGNIVTSLQRGRPTIYVTIGLFTVVQLIRNVQMLIPVYDFCIPENSCSDNCNSVSPCDVFSKIEFPTDDFFPPRLKSDCEC